MALVGCCSRFVRIGLIVLTILAMCLGIACVATFGMYGNQTDFTQFSIFFTEQVFTISTIIWVIVGLSTSLVLMSLILFFGILFERKIIIKVVVFFLAIHIVGSIAIGAYICVQYNINLENLEKNVANVMNLYPAQNIGSSIDGIQKVIQCCGWNNESDWSHTSWYFNTNKNSVLTYYAPQSCCNCTNCYPQPCVNSRSNRYYPGCKIPGIAYFMNTFNMLVGLYIPEFFLSILFFAGSTYILTNIGREEYKYS